LNTTINAFVVPSLRRQRTLVKNLSRRPRTLVKNLSRRPRTLVDLGPENVLHNENWSQLRLNARRPYHG